MKHAQIQIVRIVPLEHPPVLHVKVVPSWIHRGLVLALAHFTTDLKPLQDNVKCVRIQNVRNVPLAKIPVINVRTITLSLVLTLAAHVLAIA